MTVSVIARRAAGGIIYEIDTAKDRLDIARVHHFLADCAHWARCIPLTTLRRAIGSSLCFGLYRDGEQIGFARVISDEATFAYVADVFVIDDARNQGLGQWLVEAILAYPPLQNLRRWHLVTSNAASLYRRCGSRFGSRPTYHRHNPDAHARGRWARRTLLGCRQGGFRWRIDHDTAAAVGGRRALGELPALMARFGPRPLIVTDPFIAGAVRPGALLGRGWRGRCSRLPSRPPGHCIAAGCGGAL